MTVTYSIDVASADSFSFLRLLKKWNGSVYKIIWFELVTFFSLYAVISFVYRFAMSAQYREYFEIVCVYCSHHSDKIPIIFVMGFYVNMVAGRWWEQFLALPWPDTVSLYLVAHLGGPGFQAILYRRNIVRYINAAYCLALRSISSRARLRFPTEEHLVTAGILSSEELGQLQNSGPMDIRGQYFTPLCWAQDLVMKARKEQLIKCDVGTDAIIDAINDFRSSLGRIFAYDWINPPLVYTQTATISVYAYFLLSMFAWQFLDPEKKFKNSLVDIYVPIFGVLSFIFIMGWLKVAESMINPFGEDDDDFEIEYMIERNLEMSYAIVHGILQDVPPCLKGHLNENPPLNQSYWSLFPRVTKEDETEMFDHTDNLFLGSLANFKVPDDFDSRSTRRGSMWQSAVSLFRGNHGTSVSRVSRDQTASELPLGEGKARRSLININRNPTSVLFIDPTQQSHA